MFGASIHNKFVQNFTRRRIHESRNGFEKLNQYEGQEQREEEEDIYPASSMKGRQGRYAELSSKPCSYSNNLANGRPTNNKLSSPIKAKIQNAINKALQGETDDSGVIVVGGRRRNRKKRPNKNKQNKNANQPKKTKKNSKKTSGSSSSDSSDKENGYSFNIYAAITKATSVGRKKDDQKPLIGSEWRSLDLKEFDDRDGDSGFWTPDTENEENQETDTMPFGFGKKKKATAAVNDKTPPPASTQIVNEAEKDPEPKVDNNITESEPVKEEEEEGTQDNGHQDGTATTTTETAAVDNAKEEKETEKEEEEEEKEEEEVKEEQPQPPQDTGVETVTSDAVDGGTEETPEVEQPTEETVVEADEEPVPEKIVVETPAPVVENQPKKEPRVESTPLIGKQSKMKDTQPGFLCCVIL